MVSRLMLGGLDQPDPPALLLPQRAVGAVGLTTRPHSRLLKGRRAEVWVAAMGDGGMMHPMGTGGVMMMVRQISALASYI